MAFHLGALKVFEIEPLTKLYWIITNIDINTPKYYGNNSGSKANRLREFWRLEPNPVVGKLIIGFIEHWEFQKLNNRKLIEPAEKALAEECEAIAHRLMGNDCPDELSQEAHFEEIQETILTHLNNAQYCVWVAVAWFTDKRLFEELKKLRIRGVNVQVIIINDENNSNAGLQFEQYFETYRINKFGKYKSNIMHHKFCIIDLKTVIHGSFNWSVNAQYNNEQITVTHGRLNAEKFADQFITLKNEFN